MHQCPPYPELTHQRIEHTKDLVQSGSLASATKQGLISSRVDISLSEALGLGLRQQYSWPSITGRR